MPVEDSSESGYCRQQWAYTYKASYQASHGILFQVRIGYIWINQIGNSHE